MFGASELFLAALLDLLQSVVGIDLIVGSAILFADLTKIYHLLLW